MECFLCQKTEARLTRLSLQEEGDVLRFLRREGLAMTYSSGASAERDFCASCLRAVVKVELLLSGLADAVKDIQVQRELRNNTELETMGVEDLDDDLDSSVALDLSSPKGSEDPGEGNGEENFSSGGSPASLVWPQQVGAAAALPLSIWYKEIAAFNPFAPGRAGWLHHGMTMTGMNSSGHDPRVSSTLNLNNHGPVPDGVKNLLVPGKKKKGQPESRPPVPTVPVFRCDFSSCDEVFETKKDIRRHERQVHLPGPQRSKCDECGRVLRNARSLKTHMQLHAMGGRGRRPCPVPRCKYWIRNEKSLQPHLTKVHGLSWVMECENCERIFTSEEKWKRHEEIHRGEKYDCAQCGQNFRSKMKLGEHLVMHEREREKMERGRKVGTGSETLSDVELEVK